jgi:hypothetical protein
MCSCAGSQKEIEVGVSFRTEVEIGSRGIDSLRGEKA